MAILEALATDLAIETIKWLGSQGINYLTKSDYNDYEKELRDIIYISTNEYEKKYGNITQSGKTHFCQSQIILMELLKFRLSKRPNAAVINRVINSDERIETPTEEEMIRFLEIFSENIQKSKTLVNLNIENNYKEEIFNISSVLNTLVDAVADLKKDGPAELIEEWSRRLDEVTSNIEKFKPKTALDILQRLEERIAEKSIIVSDALNGKIIYLKASCVREFNLGYVEKTSAEQFIKAYNYLPTNIEFKAMAGFAYLVLEENDKVESIANEIIQKDEYHSGAFALKLFLKGENFSSFLNEIPAHVKNKRDFKAIVGHWIVNNHHVKTIAELDELGFNFEIIDEGEPTSITSKNKWYWTIIIAYLINKLYELNPLLSSSGFDSSMSEDKYFKYTHSILKKFATAVDGSEVEENYSWYKFQLLYMDYVISQDKYSVPFIEMAFSKIKNKLASSVIQMAQVYNSFGTAEQIRKAIKVIEDFGEDKDIILSLFNSYNHLQLKKPEDSVKSFKNYLSFHPTIDERAFYNLIQYLNLLQQQSIDAVNDIKADVTTKDFNPPVLRNLFEILTVYSDEPLNTDNALLKKIQDEIDSSSETLRFYVGMAFYINKKPNEAVTYLNSKIDKTKASQELKLYCQCLFEGNGDKLELLSILEVWRRTQVLDDGLIRMELHIREVQRNWETFVEIAKQALQFFLNDESLIYALFYGFDNLFYTEGIKSNLNLIENRDFKNERFGIAISGFLLKSGLTEEAIELLYKTASKKTNVQARSSYVASLINYPQDIFKEFPSVEIGMYVEYQFGSKSEILFIDEENAQTNIGRSLLNKTAGEFVIIGNTSISGKQITIQVLRVMNKYAALLREIFIEAENPLSGHRLEVIKFENSDAESMKKTMIDSFGAVGSMQQEFREKEFEKYYNGINSFTEIASLVFGKKRFDAYFYLTSSMGKRFKAISPSISNKEILNHESKFVLDVTSVCLFFQLSKEFELIFKHKFIISASLKRELVTLITETRMNPESKMSVNITMEGITPHFYQDGYKQNRLKFLEEILAWLDSNCEIDQVDEKLDFVLNKEANPESDRDFVYDYVDNRLLTDRPNYYLLSNDTFYYSHLNAGTSQVISPELYLEKFQNEKTREFSAFMLKCNYVGITIYSDILQDEFVNMISGKENKFPICLENFVYSWNPNFEHAKVIARFIKWLYLSNSFLNERKNQTAHTLFLTALRNATPEFALNLRDEIKTEFSLMGNKDLQVQMILLNALNMINKTNG